MDGSGNGLATSITIENLIRERAIQDFVEAARSERPEISAARASA